MKDSAAAFREAPAVKCAWIAEGKACLTVSQLCPALEVTPSGFHAWRRPSESTLTHRTASRARAGARVVEAGKCRYGSPRIHEDLFDHER